MSIHADFTLLSKRCVKREAIEDKVIWITGASRGIGEILAKQLASLGAKLIMSARNKEELERVKSQLTVSLRMLDHCLRPSFGCDDLSGSHCCWHDTFFGAASINALYRFPNLRIILLSRESLVQLLPKNHQHEIHIEPSILGSTCGLIPMSVPCSSCTTTGLEWNLSDTAMMFGGLVSTSNLVKADTVTVHSNSDLLWTIAIKEIDRDNHKHNDASLQGSE